MNISFRKILVVIVLLTGLSGLEAKKRPAKRDDVRIRLQEIEARLDEKLKLLGKSIEDICKMYAENDPDAFAEMEKLIKTSRIKADVAKGKQRLAEWKKKKQTEMWLHHPGYAGGEYHVYLFRVSDDLESALKSIVDIHWQVNKLNDDYTRAKNAAEMAKQQMDLNRAEEALNLAQQILNKSQEARKQNNKMSEELLKQAVYNTTIRNRGMKLGNVKEEVLFFIVEVTEKGKYVRAWCSRASGGSDLYISGQLINCKNMD